MIPDVVVELALDYVLRSWLTAARASLYAEPFLCVETPRKHAFGTEKFVHTLESRRELLGLVRSLVLHAKQSDLNLLDKILALFAHLSSLTALSLFVHRQEADIVAPHLKELKSLRHLVVGSVITEHMMREILALGTLSWLHLSASIGKHKKAPKFVLRNLTADRAIRPEALFKLIEPAVASCTLVSLMLTISRNFPSPNLSSLVSLKRLTFVDRVPAAKEGDKEDGAWLSLRDSEEYDAICYMLDTLESTRRLPALSSITLLRAPREKEKAWTTARYCSSAFYEALPKALRQLNLVAAPFTFDVRRLCTFLEAGSRNLPDFRLLQLQSALRASGLIQDDFEQRMRRRGVEIVWQNYEISAPSGGKRAELYE